jgi:RNA polymerase subunit RPABC4/transcription elongation factor Spt4
MPNKRNRIINPETRQCHACGNVRNRIEFVAGSDLCRICAKEEAKKAWAGANGGRYAWESGRCE